MHSHRMVAIVMALLGLPPAARAQNTDEGDEVDVIDVVSEVADPADLGSLGTTGHEVSEQVGVAAAAPVSDDVARKGAGLADDAAKVATHGGGVADNAARAVLKRVGRIGGWVGLGAAWLVWKRRRQARQAAAQGEARAPDR